jgi:hypothetical protein
MLFVGAPGRTVDGEEAAGEVHVFQRSIGGWRLGTKLKAAKTKRWTQFGGSLAVESDRVAVGTGWSGGDVTVFARSDDAWVREQTFGAPRADDGNMLMSAYGADLLLDGDTLIVGAHRLPDEENFAGAVYVYRREPDGGWSLVRRLHAPKQKPYQAYGASFAASDDWLAVGAPFIEAWALAGDPGNPLPAAEYQSGTVFVYARKQAELSVAATLVLEDGNKNDGLGSAVAIDGDTLAVSAPSRAGEGDSTGLVRVYRHADGTWSKLTDITPPTPATEAFGARIHLAGEHLVASSDGHFHHYRAKGGGFHLVRTFDRPNDETGYPASSAVEFPDFVVGQAQLGKTGTPSGHVWLYRLSAER